MKRHHTFETVLTIFLLVLALISIFPVLWILSTSFKSETEILRGGFALIPKAATFDQYRSALFDQAFASQLPILRWLFNSIFVAVCYTAITITVCSLSAFAFARLHFRGKHGIFMLLLTTMMIPSIVTMVPLYKMMVTFKWIDNYLSLILPGTANALAIFLLQQFMLGIPQDLDEAATIDGAGLFTIYWRIILPISKPALIVSALFVMMNNWNDFLWPSIVTNSPKMRTLPAGLRILQAAHQTDYGKLAVAAVISALPVFCIYLFAQKYFIKGISISGSVKS